MALNLKSPTIEEFCITVKSVSILQGPEGLITLHRCRVVEESLGTGRLRAESGWRWHWIVGLGISYHARQRALALVLRLVIIFAAEAAGKSAPDLVGELVSGGGWLPK
jgi:hypothetical protein